MSLMRTPAVDYSNYDVQMEDILQRLCQSLQLSPSHYEQAKTSYNYVANWLQDDPMFSDCHLEIYPQGSVRIGTTVKPSKKEEFDVDLVLEIHDSKEKFEDPIALLDQIERRLRENRTYLGMIHRKNRCIQLQYANQYHMDILPALPTNQKIENCLKVPDSETRRWKPSNPKGYAEWFELIAENFESLLLWHQIFEKSANAKIEDLPELETVEVKPPLKRAVQLIKHYRNRYFEGQDIKPPISIVLTTLAAQCYGGQGSVYLAIEAILDGITNLINDTPMIKVYNPKNPGELLSERWEKEPAQYEAFKEFIQNLKNHWEVLPQLQNTGMVNLSKSLSEIFEPSLVQEGFKKQALYQDKMRRRGLLSLNKAGLLTADDTASAIIIPQNTFYGD